VVDRLVVQEVQEAAAQEQIHQQQQLRDQQIQVAVAVALEKDLLVVDQLLAVQEL
jgi:hypothetical protein